MKDSSLTELYEIVDRAIDEAMVNDRYPVSYTHLRAHET